MLMLPALLSLQLHMKDKGKKRVRLVERILWILIMFFSVLLLFSIISPLIHPGKLWIPAFFGLAYPYLAAVTLLLALMMSFFNFRKSALPVLVFLTGIGPCRHTFHFSGSSNLFSERESDCKILSHNVHLFGAYDEKTGSTLDSVKAFVKQQNAHVVCFQEFYERDREKGANVKELMQAGGFSNHVVTSYARAGKNGYIGMIILTKFPVLKSGSVKNPVPSSKEISAVWCDLLIGADTVRIYNVHLQSIGFSRTDEKLFGSGKQSQEELEQQSRSVFRKLRHAFVNRAQQVEEIMLHMSSCKHSCFITGDFNDTPVSYTYRKLRGELSDAFLDAGSWGMGKTYRGPYPSFRIDYILYPDEFEAAEFIVHNKTFSDHFPISCRFRRTK